MLLVEASLWLIEGQTPAFERYEAIAAEVVAELGARMVEVRSPLRTGPDDPHEVHVLHFPSREVFRGYRSHPKLQAAEPLRASCVARTEIRLTDIEE